MKQFYTKNFKSCVLGVLSLLVLILYNADTLNAQILTDFPCYTVNEDGGADPNNLFEYDPATDQWNNIGEIDPIGDLIEAIATDPVNDIIYAYDAGTDVLGIIDPNAANPTAFVPIDPACVGLGVGTGNGDYGAIVLDDVDGLTYDPINMILYGSHRINSGDICNPIANTNDLLFQIDVSTGKFIPGAMLDANGAPADYAVVEETVDGTALGCCTVGGGVVYDVDDIAYNPYTGELYAIQNQDGPGTITILNPVDGTVETTIFDLNDKDIEGLGFTYLGELYATGGDNASGDCGAAGVVNNAFIYIDLQNQTTEVQPFPDPTNTFVDFESFDCLTAFNDLALDKVLDPSITGPVYPGDNVTFLVTVYNQGDFDNYDILVTDYIPTGLTLVPDANWSQVAGTNTAEATIPGPLVVGAPITIPITFTVDPTFTGGTIDNYAEITTSSNPAITDVNGDVLPLPDIDSEPDANNNELTDGDPIVDNEINQGGPNANPPEDEDDHDVASIFIPTFDLALAKTLGANQTTPVYPGQDVTFTITVTNQGNVDAANVNLIDYIPTGFTLSANDTNGWVASGTDATNTIAGPITANGGTATVDIVLTVDPTATQGDLVNFAEITSAEDTNGNMPTDVDSTPASDPNNAGGAPTTGSDDSIDGDGTGMPGDTDPLTDEDDHDPALVPVEIFDLALIKETASTGPFLPGDDITFTITVQNQGTIDALNILVTDYLPAGLILSPNDANNWVAAGANVTNTIAGPLTANGGTTTVDIVLQADGSVFGPIENNAEITSAEDTNGNNPIDVDSTPDNNPNNDAGGVVNTGTDDILTGDGIVDEDDEDPEDIIVGIYDLALTKTTAQTTPVFSGDAVTFTITIFNQGSVPASNVEVTDYIPAGLELCPTDANGWTLNSPGVAVNTIAGPIAASSSATVDIDLCVDGTVIGPIVNIAEISGDDGDDTDSTTDNMPGNDAGGAENTGSDNSTGGDGSGNPGDTNPATDEDDADPEDIVADPCPTVGGEVFIDVNNNGCQDAAETMMAAGVEVTLWVCDPATGQPSATVTTTTTGADGSYSFGGGSLTPGDGCLVDPTLTYTVSFNIPAGSAFADYTFSAGTADATCPDGSADDVDPQLMVMMMKVLMQV